MSNSEQFPPNFASNDWDTQLAVVGNSLFFKFMQDLKSLI